MMKRLGIAAAVLCVFAVAACGGDNKKANEAESTSTASASAEPAPASSSSATPADSSSPK
ncbi:MAG: hypothetical protein U0271_05620 [Polyangiaceae bacterium]